MARPFRFSALRPVRPFFPPSSPARPACRFTPAPPSDEPNVRFAIRVNRIPIPETDDREADAVAGTAAMHKQFEAFIRQAPEQWMWAHRKWD